MTIRAALLAAFSLLCSSSLLAAGPLERENTIQVAKVQEQDLNRAIKGEPRLIISEDYTYYDVNGSSASEVRRQMRANGTKWNDGQVYAALTTWDISYNYGIASENGSYRVDDIRTTIDIHYTLPRWKPGTTPPENLAWQSYSEKLLEHEVGHGDLAVEGAAAVNKALAGLGSFASKDELRREAERAVQAALKQLKQVQVAYDDHTRHGETQGAVLN